MRAARALVAVTGELKPGMSGASGLVAADGSVEQTRFEAFAGA